MKVREYKVWIEVEELDLATGEYTNDPVPESAGTFDTEEEARLLQRKLANATPLLVDGDNSSLHLHT